MSRHTGEEMRARAIDIIGAEAFGKLDQAGIAMVDADSYRRAMAHNAREMQRLREVCIASAESYGHTTVRAELSEQDGTVYAIVTHPHGDEEAAVTYLGNLLRAVVESRHGRPADGNPAAFPTAPAAYVPGPKFPTENNPGRGTVSGVGLSIYGGDDYVVIEGLSGVLYTHVRLPRHGILVVMVAPDLADDGSGVTVTATCGENGWSLSFRCLGPDGDREIPWGIEVDGDNGSPRANISCPDGTQVAWVIK